METAIWVTGNVGSDVELREFGERICYASFRLACTPRSWRGGHWADEETIWLPVVCGKLLAPNVNASISKGDPVVVAGRLRTERWTDASGGSHERLKLEAQAVGHDLTRGRSVFRRTARAGSDESSPSSATEAESAAPLTAAEEIAADAAG